MPTTPARVTVHGVGGDWSIFPPIDTSTLKLHFLRKRPSAAFSEMVKEVVNTVYQAASVIRRSANEKQADEKQADALLLQ